MGELGTRRGGQDSHSDHRILDPSEFGKLGGVFSFLANGAPDRSGTQFIIDKVRPGEAGSKLLQRKVAGPTLSAQNQLNPSIITMVIESTVIDNGNAAIPGGSSSILQGILQFGTGSGQQGAQPSIPIAATGGDTDGRIIFDIDSGVFISFPASFFHIDFLYTGTRAAGWPANQVIGPNYQVTFSLGYGAQVHVGEVTMTQFCPTCDLAKAAANIQFFSRPKYSTGVFFQWTEWNQAGFTPLEVMFINGQGTICWDVPAYSNVANPPAILPWPADAVALSVTNLAAGVMTNFRAVHILEF